MSRMSRIKGKVGEREVVALARLEPDCFFEPRRGINQGRSGIDVPDVILDDDHWPEVKRQKNPSALAALRQAVVDEAAAGAPPACRREPIAICRDDNDPLGWVVSMRWEYFVELVRAKRQLELVVAKTSTAAELERGDLGPLEDAPPSGEVAAE